MPRKQFPPDNELAILVQHDLFTNADGETTLRNQPEEKDGRVVDHWFRHDGRHYRAAELLPLIREIRQYFRNIDPALSSESMAKRVLKEIRYLPHVHIPQHWAAPCFLPPSEPFPDERSELLPAKEFINLQNGFFDYQNQILLPHSASVFDLSSVEYGWEPKAKAPVFKRFLHRSLSGDWQQIRLALEWLGYLTTWRNDQKKILVIIGEADSGKSVFCRDIITPLVGEESVSNIRLEAFGARFEDGVLQGKKVNVTSEARFAGVVIEERLKQISGGDTIFQDLKCKDGVTYKPSARLVISGNSDPRFSDTSNAIWNRLSVLSFNNSLPRDEWDLQLGDKLRAELPGIFVLAMLALEGMDRRG